MPGRDMETNALVMSLNAVLALTLMAAPAASAQSMYDFDLPAQPLETSLTAVGSKTRTNVIFSPESVAGKRAVGLRGTYSAADALRVLLSETGLGVTTTRGGSYIVSPLPETVVAPVLTPVIQPDDAPRTVVVTGYRNSLAEALRLKKNALGIVDVVVAEDIAKFPDNNLAEAIQRVPGVAITRDQGEGRTITVRGLGPDFTRVEINGLEAQAATDGLAQGTNRGRGFDFNVFPSELFSRIDVRKTSSATQAEGSLGATVNLVTPHPLDRKGFRLAASAQASYNDLADEAGRRAAFLISDTFDGDRLGALFSTAYSRTPIEIQGVNSGGWNQATANGGFCKPVTGTGGVCNVSPADLPSALTVYNLVNKPTVYNPQFYRYTNLIGYTERLGMVGSLQWQPTAKTALTLDLLYSHYKTERTDYFLEAIGFSRGASQGGKPETLVREAEVNDDGTMIYGLFDNVDVRSEIALDYFTTTFKEGTLRFTHEFGNGLKLDLLAGGSYSKFDNYKDIGVQIDRFNIDGYVFDIRQGGPYNPSIRYGFDLEDPTSWYFGPRITQPGGTGATGPEIRPRPNYTRNGYEVVQAKFAYPLGGGWVLNAGAEAKQYSFRTIGYRLDQGDTDFPAPAGGIASVTKRFCGLAEIAPPADTARCWLVPDIDAFAEAYNLFGNTGRTAVSTTNPAARGYNQAVGENDRSVFASAEFRKTIWGLPVRGDIGIRQVRTHQTSVFYTNVPVTVDPSGFRLTRVERTYTDSLPSLNLAADLPDNAVLRFSAAKVMARPPLASIAAATSVVVNGGARAVLTGNPNLQPYRAASYDLSYEWYPTRGAVAAIGLFHKNISTYIQTLSHIAPYSTTGLPASLLQNTGVAVTDDFIIQTSVNTPGGPLSGVEINYQQPLHFLKGKWSGFGVLFNYTYVDSRIEYATTTALGAATVRADLAYLSRNSANATLYYDKGKFEARVSMNYRDEYLTGVPGSFNTDANGVDAATYWDASATYHITDKLVLALEGLNLTDETNVTWSDTVAHRVTDYRLSGRRFYAGLRYSF